MASNVWESQIGVKRKKKKQSNKALDSEPKGSLFIRLVLTFVGGFEIAQANHALFNYAREVHDLGPFKIALWKHFFQTSQFTVNMVSGVSTFFCGFNLGSDSLRSDVIIRSIGLFIAFIGKFSLLMFRK